MKSPVQVRSSFDGPYVAVTLRVVVGPSVHDTRQLLVGAPGRPDDLDLIAKLRGEMADVVAQCIRTDQWPDVPTADPING